MGKMEERLYNTIKSHYDSIDWKYDEERESLMMSFSVTLDSEELNCVSYVDPTYQVFGIYSVLEYEISEEKRDELLWFVNEINSNLSVGRIFYGEEDRKIRCIIESTYDESLISKSVAADMLVFLVNNASSIEKSVIGLSKGALTKEEAYDLYCEQELLQSSNDFIDNTERVYKVLCDAFDSIEYTYEKKSDNMSIVFSATGDDEPVGYSIRTMKDFKAIRLVAFVCDVSSAKEKMMLEAVNCANKNIVVGSLELSHNSVYYVSNLFFAESIISKEAILDLYNASMEICDGLNNKFADLSSGKISLEEFIEFFE